LKLYRYLLLATERIFSRRAGLQPGRGNLLLSSALAAEAMFDFDPSALGLNLLIGVDIQGHKAANDTSRLHP